MTIDDIMEQVRKNQEMKIKRCKHRLRQINKMLKGDIKNKIRIFDEIEPKMNGKNNYYEYLTDEEIANENNNNISKIILIVIFIANNGTLL